MTESHGLSPSSIESIAGFTAGLTSTLAVHPLDIIKTRLQIDRNARNQFGSSWQIARRIAHEEGTRGMVRAFYRGLTPNIVGNSLGWSLYFLWYGQAQDVLHTIHGHKKEGATQSGSLSSADYLVASAGAGALSAMLINPVWVIKTRMLSTGASHAGAYPSMTAGLKSLFVNEGFRGYARGLIPALAGVSHGALYFVAYEKLKKMRAEAMGKETASFTNLEYLFISGLAKVWAGCITYPHQVVRARLQTYSSEGMQYHGVLDVIKRVWQHEGISGFYKGLGPNLIRVVPSTCVTFIVYENVKWSLSERNKRMNDV